MRQHEEEEEEEEEREREKKTNAQKQSIAFIRLYGLSSAPNHSPKSIIFIREFECYVID